MRTAYRFLSRALRFLQLHRVPGLIKIMPDVRRERGGVVLPHELEPKYASAWRRLQRMEVLPGDYLEFGVSRGTSLACMHRVVTRLSLNNVRLFGFDSFEGMPSNAAWEDLGVWRPGQFASSVAETTEYLTENSIDWNRTCLVQGWFDQTLTDETTRKFGIRKASVVMMDCHLYSATRAALNYVKPLIADFVVLFFDDWQTDASLGEHRAYIEFLEENPHLVSKDFGEYRPSGRIFFVINTREEF